MSYDTFQDEKRMQPFMDKFYRDWGFEIDRSGSCKKYDVVVKKDGNIYRIEEKYLFTDKQYTKMLVEIMQDAITGDVGWFYHTDCEYIYWAYCYPDRQSGIWKIYQIRWGLLKEYVNRILDDNKWTTFNLCSKNYGATINLPVVWNALLQESIALIAHDVQQNMFMSGEQP